MVKSTLRSYTTLDRSLKIFFVQFRETFNPEILNMNFRALTTEERQRKSFFQIFKEQVLYIVYMDSCWIRCYLILLYEYRKLVDIYKILIIYKSELVPKFFTQVYFHQGTKEKNETSFLSFPKQSTFNNNFSEKQVKENTHFWYDLFLTSNRKVYKH